ncbi:zinc finger protein 346 [Osmerus mordax]|uniref:zinc finger protein 346 n=1 Tax=Osmerus mordax TaxID=8014 RepID=UPI00350FDFEB
MALEEQNGDFPFLPSGAAEVNRMIKENGNLFSDSQCKVCSAVLISDSQKLAHYQSKKHANKVRRYMGLQKDEEPAIKKLKSPSSDSASSNGQSERYKACHVCNMSFSSAVVAESHYQGKVHAKNLKLKTFGPQAPAVAPPPPAAPLVKRKVEETGGVAPSLGPAQNDPDRFCPICHASFNNPMMARQHYVGKKHKKQLTKMKLMETYGPSTTPASTVKGYPCAVCNLELNSVEQYQAHISGSKHKNQVKKVGSSTAFVGPSENRSPTGEPAPGGCGGTVPSREAAPAG